MYSILVLHIVVCERNENRKKEEIIKIEERSSLDKIIKYKKKEIISFLSQNQSFKARKWKILGLFG